MKFNLKNFKFRETPSLQTRRSGTLSYMNPIRDWTAGLAVATLVLTVGAVFIGYDFYKQFGAPSREVVAEIQPVVYREKDVIEYAELYAEKEETFNALRKSRVYVAPPVEQVAEPLADE